MKIKVHTPITAPAGVNHAISKPFLIACGIEIVDGEVTLHVGEFTQYVLLPDDQATVVMSTRPLHDRDPNWPYPPQAKLSEEERANAVALNSLFDFQLRGWSGPKLFTPA